jgi:NADH dehydrogenase/NADH:ubiquinone oxidoreductase subunit G
VKEILLKIDGKEVKAREGMTILQAARSREIDIPTLCYHEKLEPYGACRICTVEIETRGRIRFVASCLYPVEEGLIVRTRSEGVIKIRRMLLEMMLAKAPEAKGLKDLAHEYGVTEVRFENKSSFCILCGLCERYCTEIKKKNVIGFIGRGTEREIIFIPEIAFKECMDCKECFPLCPTCALQANFVLTQALMSRPPSESKSKG